MINKDKTKPVYMIGVVADILGVHPQTLRLYEREGFICPVRQNKQRIYSDEDIERLNFILELTRDLGVNRAGVEIVLRLHKRLGLVRQEMDEMMTFLDDEDIKMRFREKLADILEKEEI
jgi:MerR family transcriptional regulator/heat shock protein HspR